MIDKIYAADFAVLDFIREHISTPALDYLMRFFSLLGEGAVLWIVIAALLLTRKKHRQTALEMASAMIFGSVVWIKILKNIVRRPRPFITRSETELILRAPGGVSFPSGHSMVAFACATVIFLNNRRAGIAAYVTAALIAFSRLYLYVHFPSDVLVGSLLGVITGTLVHLILKKAGNKG